MVRIQVPDCEICVKQATIATNVVAVLLYKAAMQASMCTVAQNEELGVPLVLHTNFNPVT